MTSRRLRSARHFARHADEYHLARLLDACPSASVRQVKMAMALTKERCPVEECDGDLWVYPSFFDDEMSHTSEHVPMHHRGCTGEPMHVWRVIDLFRLQGRPVKTVVQR